MQRSVARKGAAFVAALTLSSVGVFAGSAAGADGDEMFTYTASSSNTFYADFAAAAGKTNTSAGLLAADLSVYDCVVLASNTDFDDRFDPIALDTYVRGGGRLIAVAERSFPSAAPVDRMNEVATAIGSSMRLTAANTQPSPTSTTDVADTPFANGVSSVGFAGYSPVDPGATGVGLVFGADGTAIVAGEPLGAGIFFMSGDSNVFNNFTGAFDNHDNAAFIANLCDRVAFESAVIPIEIDVHPGKDKAIKGKGPIPVAILTTPLFDAATIDEATLTFGPDGGTPSGKSRMKDVDKDGDLDLLVKVRFDDTGLAPGDTEACMLGATLGGDAVEGCAPVEVR